MCPENVSAPTSLTADTLSGWNTLANGTGTSYAIAASYLFATSTNHYALPRPVKPDLSS